MINKIKRLYQKLFWTNEQYGRHIGVKIGKGCYISTSNFSSEPYLIEIGDHVRIASKVSFFTHGGLWSQRKKHANLDYFGKIKIGNYTYIGESAMIMPGVEIGDDCIIGAGTVVTKSVPSGSIVAGNPARLVGNTADFVAKTQAISLPTYKMSDEETKLYLLSLTDDKFVKKPLIK